MRPNSLPAKILQRTRPSRVVILFLRDGPLGIRPML